MHTIIKYFMNKNHLNISPRRLYYISQHYIYFVKKFKLCATLVLNLFFKFDFFCNYDKKLISYNVYRIYQVWRQVTSKNFKTRNIYIHLFSKSV